MNISYGLGFIAGIIISIFCVSIICRYFLRKDKGKKCVYDERQNKIRAKGYSYAYSTLLVYLVIYGGLDTIMDKHIIDSMAAVFIGICLSILVYAIYSYWHDAYIGLNERINRCIILFGVIAVLNIWIGISQIASKEMVVNGILTYRSVNFICGITFLILLAAFLLKKIIKTNEE